MTSNDAAKSDKLKLEEQKLALEIEELKKPFYKRPGIWTSTITLALAVAGLFTQGVLSDLENKRTLLVAEQKTADADKREAEANLASQEAESRVAEAEERTQSLLWEARKLEIDQTALKSAIVSTQAELDDLLKTVDRIRTSGTQMTPAELSAIQAELKGTRDALRLRVCSDSQRNASNTALELSATDEKAAKEWHAPWGLPEAADGQYDTQRLFQVWWITGYSKIGKIPLWTIHRLDALAGEERKRVNCWRPDPRIPAEFTASLSDYPSGFDKGHLVPRADVDFSEVAQTSSFILSNGTPQVPELNRTAWSSMEKIARERKSSGQNEIFVISGSIFDYDADGIADATIGTRTIGANKVSVSSIIL